MATAETKNRIYSVIEAMPLDKLDAVLAFLDDLQRSSEEETAFLLGDASFMRDYREAKEETAEQAPLPAEDKSFHLWNRVPNTSNEAFHAGNDPFDTWNATLHASDTSSYAWNEASEA